MGGGPEEGAKRGKGQFGVNFIVCHKRFVVPAAAVSPPRNNVGCPPEKELRLRRSLVYYIQGSPPRIHAGGPPTLLSSRGRNTFAAALLAPTPFWMQSLEAACRPARA